MKKIYLALTIGLLLVSCGGESKSNDGKKFEPIDRTTSKLSDAEKTAAIANKKACLRVNVATLLDRNNVKLSVLAPMPGGDVNIEHSEQIAMKMLEVISQNGIGGINNVPSFALNASIMTKDKKVTGTAPQRMLITYTLNYKVLNVTTSDVYASSNIDIVGAGGSFEEATQNAIENIKNTPAIQTMLAEASIKIINWYEQNLQVFKNQVSSASAQNNYALALALIESVPQQATTAFEYATKMHPTVLKKLKQSIAEQEFAALKQAAAQVGDELNPEVYAHLQMLPKDSKEYAVAKKLISNYENKVYAKREKNEQIQIAKEESEAERKNALKMAEIETEKLKIKYQYKATQEALRAKEYQQKGFFGCLGDKILGGIDFLSDTISDTIDM